MEDRSFQKSIRDFLRIHRIITALSSTKNPEDIYSIILCSLISPQGLNFTRSFLFTYDEKFDVFTGNMMLGPSTSKEAKELLSELKNEETTLDSIIKNNNLEENHEVEVWDLCLSALKMSALWISIAQKIGAQNPLSESIRRLSFSGKPKTKGENFFHEICASQRALIIDKDKNQPVIPPSIAEIIAHHFVALPISSKNRPYAVVLLDRKFSRKSVTQKDLASLQWFLAQASLAVENAVLYQNLQFAYRDIKELDVLKSNFLSTVSHELRTPLTTIHGFVELLMEERAGEITDNQKQILLRVAKNARHLINLVNDIIEVAEINVHGKTDLMVEPVDPYPIMLRAVERVKERRTEKNIRFDIQPGKKSPFIMAEKISLERIFYHILDNAVKFSPHNGKVSVSFLKKNGELQIAISDEGIGIDQENLARIFDFFFQVDGNLNRSYEGLGLGLTITRFLLVATGGKILAETTPGKGSTFVVVYPVTGKSDFYAE
ncbi:HAMP domain-containing histidine kinase [Candidatus Sumerlaeota bacterium]|nr:HAMP domain-containing histidine kinase [Candidatus Sumerlaeota bacterium]